MCFMLVSSLDWMTGRRALKTRTLGGLCGCCGCSGCARGRGRGRRRPAAVAVCLAPAAVQLRSVRVHRQNRKHPDVTTRLRQHTSKATAARARQQQARTYVRRLSPHVSPHASPQADETPEDLRAWALSSPVDSVGSPDRSAASRISGVYRITGTTIAVTLHLLRESTDGRSWQLGG